MADITVAQLTTGTVAGNGVFDELMKAVNAQLTEQFDKNRITGSDYATVYLGAMQNAMAQGVQFLLGEQIADKQADLLIQKIETEKAQTEDTVTAGPVAGTVKKQQDLLTAQTDGFARDAEQKVLKIMMDAYAIQRSTDSAFAPPINADNTSIDHVIAKAADGIGIPDINAS